MSANTRITHIQREKVPESLSTDLSAEPSLGELFSELSTNMGELVRQEIQLAKVETQETIGNAAKSVIMMVVGGVVAYAGFIVLLFAAAAVLSLVMDLWLAHVIVGALVIIVGVLLLVSARSVLTELSIIPTKTIETVKNDAEWAKEQLS